MKYLSILLKVAVTHCSQNKLKLSNDFDKDIIIRSYPYENYVDSINVNLDAYEEFHIKENEVKEIRLKTYKTMYDGYASQVKPIYIYDSNYKLIKTYRISESFINQLGSQFSIPFDPEIIGSDFESSLSKKDLIGLTKSERIQSHIYTKSNRILFHYNTDDFSNAKKYSSKYLFENLEETIFTEKQKKHKTKLDIENASLKGVALIGVLSSLKTNDTSEAERFIEFIETNYPQYWTTIKENDNELKSLINTNIKKNN